jgi:hypothetical protein
VKSLIEAKASPGNHVPGLALFYPQRDLLRNFSLCDPASILNYTVVQSENAPGT